MSPKLYNVQCTLYMHSLTLKLFAKKINEGNIEALGHLSAAKYVLQQLAAVKGTPALHLSLKFCSLMSHFHQEIPAPKKVQTIFVLEEQTSKLDQGMGVLVCVLQAARIAL